MSDFLSPPPSLLCKLVSIAVHVEELLSEDGHWFDKDALDQLLADPEVKTWINGMSSAGLAPRKRTA